MADDCRGVLVGVQASRSCPRRVDPPASEGGGGLRRSPSGGPRARGRVAGAATAGARRVQLPDRWPVPRRSRRASRRPRLARGAGDGRGYRGVEPDNLDSWTRSRGALTVADNLALARLLILRAHELGLAIARRPRARIRVLVALVVLGRSASSLALVGGRWCQPHRPGAGVRTGRGGVAATDAGAGRGLRPRGARHQADQIALMTYDDHGPRENRPGPIGPRENRPGPIGPLRWQRAAATRSSESCQQAMCSWASRTSATRGGAARQRQPERRASPSPRRPLPRPTALGSGSRGVTARLGDGSPLWWSDGRSITRRIALARALGVHWIAVLSLGPGDPIPRVHAG
jgi:hypothetical protein